jgi:nitrate/nitrite transport system permease protein
MARMIRLLETLGLNWFVPVIRLITGQNPPEQIRQIFRTIVTPVMAFLVFLLLWGRLAGSVETSIGNVPGPREVWAEARTLVEEHRQEKAKEKEFYAQQEERRARFAERFPDKEFKERLYSGAPTFFQQVITSLKTVFAGFLIASLIAIPLGILCGLSQTFYQAVNPLIQIFKPVSPLAWLPIVMILVSALYTSDDPMFEKSFISSAITVALCSLWSTLINTAIGVASIEPEYINVARSLNLSWTRRLYKVVLPSSLPYIFTGLRLSLGVGWMVLIAAEMLAQNPGLGKFVWDMFQNGSSQTLSQIMVAVFAIGIIGFALDRIMIVLQKLVSFDEAVVVR